MYWRFRPVSNIPSLNILKQAEEYCVTSFIVKGFLLTSKLNQKFGNGFKLKVLSFTISNLASQHCSQRGFFFFYLGFLSLTFTIHRTAEEGGGYLLNSSLPLPPASQALRHQPGDYCGGLTSEHGWQPDSYREPLVSERNSLTTKLRALEMKGMKQTFT